MNKKEALKIINEELKQRENFEMYENDFNYDDDYIIAYGLKTGKKYDYESRLIIDLKDGSSFIEML